jgi:hypothetical protein
MYFWGEIHSTVYMYRCTFDIKYIQQYAYPVRCVNIQKIARIVSKWLLTSFLSSKIASRVKSVQFMKYGRLEGTYKRIAETFWPT